jgi:hypothetical protein
MYELAMTFADYVQHYGLARSEGLVLRYLTDAYKGLVQTVPEDAKTDEVYDLTEWLREIVRQTDSSLIDEWERLGSAADAPEALPVSEPDLPAPPPAVTANARAFRLLVRNEAFRRIELLARRAHRELAEIDGRLSAETVAEMMAPYWEEHESLGTGPDARSGARFQFDGVRVRQVLDDPAGDHDWAMILEVDLAASDEAGAAVVHITGVSADLP